MRFTDVPAVTTPVAWGPGGARQGAVGSGFDRVWYDRPREQGELPLTRMLCAQGLSED